MAGQTHGVYLVLYSAKRWPPPSSPRTFSRRANGVHCSIATIRVSTSQSAREGAKRGAQKVEEESFFLPWTVFRDPVARVRQALDANEIRHPAVGRLSDPPTQESVPLASDYKHWSFYPLQQCPRLPRSPQEGAIVVEGRRERPRLRHRLYVPFYVLGGERLRLYRVATQDRTQEKPASSSAGIWCLH